MPSQPRRPAVEVSPTVLVFDEIEDGGSSRAFALEPAVLELEDRYFSFVGEVEVELQLHRALDHFQVDARIGCSIRGECCRCLVETQKRVEAELRLLLQRKEAGEDELEAVEEEDDIEIVQPGSREFDLKDYLREAVLLEMPMRVYANDACEGEDALNCLDGNPVPQGQSEAGGDPRWDALAGLKFSK